MFKQFALFAVVVLLFLIVGCTPPGTRGLGQETGTPILQAATGIPSEPAATPTEETLSASPTASPLPTDSVLLPATPTLPTAVPAAGAPSGQANCTYQASFVADVTIQDGTVMAPGQGFTKTWRLRNDGTCTWGYAGSRLHRLVYVGGNPLSAPPAVELPFPELGPGGTVDISVPMIAPMTPGTVTSQWRLQVDNGPQVGVGPNGDSPLYVQIVVPSGSRPTPVSSWASFTSPKYGYAIAYPYDWTVATQDLGTVGDAVQVERVTFAQRSNGNSNSSATVTIEAAQHSFSKPVQCQIASDVIPGLQGCRRYLPQLQGPSQELVWFQAPMAGQGYLYVSMQLTYNDLIYVTAFAHMQQTFRYNALTIPVPPPGPCTYRASFVADVTIPDGTLVSPGASFTKTWRLRNEGTCTWGYAGSKLHRLVFVSGDPLGAPISIELPFPELGQGGTVDISVPMVAPLTPGTYISNWRLQVDNGPQVGVGPNGDTPLSARITVPGPATPTAEPPPVLNSYTSSKYHYNIDFPATWTINVQTFTPSGPGSNPEVVLLSAPNAMWATVQIYALTGAPPIQGYDNCKNMTFNGVPACEIIRSDGPVPQRSLVFQKGDAYFIMDARYTSLDQLDRYEEIVLSFRFTQ